eukprot:CAMPEP_0177777792 /NCGR_PEP_ID=MMETSP0491_2-20121128/15578_1 /TAXON_ID=63592 /ORGANISM="Tetraselmis chuii, Strain PLY429" /LENGTH=200 /DNA_ID=CAMNT_0019296959 /DNA_START=62 /DNA_END=660 /DNA_ORIENTATION=-
MSSNSSTDIPGTLKVDTRPPLTKVTTATSPSARRLSTRVTDAGRRAGGGGGGGGPLGRRGGAAGCGVTWLGRARGWRVRSDGGPGEGAARGRAHSQWGSSADSSARGPCPPSGLPSPTTPPRAAAHVTAAAVDVPDFISLIHSPRSRPTVSMSTSLRSVTTLPSRSRTGSPPPPAMRPMVFSQGKTLWEGVLGNESSASR